MIKDPAGRDGGPSDRQIFGGWKPLISREGGGAVRRMMASCRRPALKWIKLFPKENCVCMWSFLQGEMCCIMCGSMGEMSVLDLKFSRIVRLGP